MIVKSMKQCFERQRNDDYSKQQTEIIYMNTIHLQPRRIN